MEITDDMIMNLLLIANASLVAACSIALLRFRKQARRFEQFWESPTGVSIADTQSLQAESAARPAPAPTDPCLEQRVAELQAVVRGLAQKSQPAAHTVDGRLPIENAVRMARGGASIDELIRSCGLSIGEAQLLCKLHGKAGRADHKARATA